MTELSPECLQQEPPFTLVGLDIVGPREVVIHWTRDGNVDTKRWTILFICNSTGSQQVPQAESLHFEGCVYTTHVVGDLFILSLFYFQDIASKYLYVLELKGCVYVGCCISCKLCKFMLYFAYLTLVISLYEK